MKKKTETPEQTYTRWMSDPSRRTIYISTLLEMGWEAGQVTYIECHGMRYERFPLPNGTFCVVEWDDGGNITVA